MANNVKFEGKDRRMPGIEKFLADNGLGSLEDEDYFRSCVAQVKACRQWTYEQLGLLGNSPHP